MSIHESLDTVVPSATTEPLGIPTEEVIEQDAATARSPLMKWKESSYNFKVWTTTAALTLVVIACVYLPSKQTFLSVNAETETLVYRVARQDLAGIMLVNASITASADCQEQMDSDLNNFVGLLRPIAGAVVRYRWSTESLSIEITSPAGTNNVLHTAKNATDNLNVYVAKLENSEGGVCDLSLGSRISIPTNERPAIPLPIAGPLEIGVPFGVPLTPRRGATWHTGIMYGATVQVYGRAFYTGNLYPVSDTPINIPSGSALISPSFSFSSRKDESDNKNGVSSWYGIAISGDRGFHVSATVDTADLRFYRAGGFSDTEEFNVSFLIELIRDPILSKIVLCLGVATLIFQIAVAYFAVRPVIP